MARETDISWITETRPTMYMDSDSDILFLGAESVEHQTLTYHTQDGLDIFGQSWLPKGEEPRAVVCLVHGLGEHASRYEPLGHYLAERRYALFTYDMRGHGRSAGPRGDAPSYDALLSDIGLPLTEAARRYAKAPRFLYGHSMGGNLVLNYALRRTTQLTGVIASSPWLRLAFAPPSWKQTVGRLLLRLRPGATLDAALDAADLSHDEEVVAAYAQDRLVHGRVSARLYFAIAEGGEYALAHAAEFRQPLLMMQGSADPIVDPAATREFAEQVRGRCNLLFWDGLFHELHNEVEREEVFEALWHWMEERRPV